METIKHVILRHANGREHKYQLQYGFNKLAAIGYIRSAITRSEQEKRLPGEYVVGGWIGDKYYGQSDLFKKTKSSDKSDSRRITANLKNIKTVHFIRYKKGDVALYKIIYEYNGKKYERIIHVKHSDFIIGVKEK